MRSLDFLLHGPWSLTMSKIFLARHFPFGHRAIMRYINNHFSILKLITIRQVVPNSAIAAPSDAAAKHKYRYVVEIAGSA